MEAEVSATYALFKSRYTDFHVNTPLGTKEDLPFDVMRTHRGNLPVYSQLKMGGN